MAKLGEGEGSTTSDGRSRKGWSAKIHPVAASDTDRVRESEGISLSEFLSLYGVVSHFLCKRLVDPPFRFQGIHIGDPTTARVHARPERNEP